MLSLICITVCCDRYAKQSQWRVKRLCDTYAYIYKHSCLPLNSSDYRYVKLFCKLRAIFELRINGSKCFTAKLCIVVSDNDDDDDKCY